MITHTQRERERKNIGVYTIQANSMCADLDGLNIDLAYTFSLSSLAQICSGKVCREIMG